MTLIEGLLPETWPAQVTDALKHWHQGHIIEAPPIFWAADPQTPLLPFTEENGDRARMWQVFSLPEKARADYGVVVSQSCDICEAKHTNPFICVAPVVDLSNSLQSSQKNDLIRHRYNDYVYLTKQPQPDKFFVADLRILLPLEKGALVSRQPIDGFATEGEQLIFADRLATRVRRPAYANVVHDMVIAPLNNWMRDDSRAALRENSGRFTDIEEVRLRIEGDRLEPRSVQVVAFQETELNPADRGAWRRWREQTQRQLRKKTGIDLRPVMFSDLSRMPASEYRKLAPVWLSGLGREARM